MTHSFVRVRQYGYTFCQLLIHRDGQTMGLGLFRSKRHALRRLAAYLAGEQ